MGIVSAIRRFASWYTRRRLAVQFLIAVAVILGPIFIYTYMTAPKPELPATLQDTALPTEASQLNVCDAWGVVSGGKLVLDYGHPVIESFCLEINSTHYIYRHPGGYGLLVIIGEGDMYVLLSWPISMVIDGYNVSELTVYAPIHNYTDYNIAGAIRRLPGYDALCAAYQPEDGDWYYSWTRGGLPSAFYHLICNEKH